MKIQIEPNRVYTIGAAGFWLDRLKPTLRRAKATGTGQLVAGD